MIWQSTSSGNSLLRSLVFSSIISLFHKQIELVTDHADSLVFYDMFHKHCLQVWKEALPSSMLLLLIDYAIQHHGFIQQL